MRQPNNYSNVLSHGIKIYPVYQFRNQYKGEKLIYEKNNWYIEVDNNGAKTRYAKSIGVGKILRGKNAGKQISLTIDYWSELIKKQLK